MAFAGDLTLVEVRDNWLKADGTPENGTLTFTPAVKVRALATGQQIAPTPVVKRLDNSGQISVLLPATDDPDYDPTGWTYTVTVTLDNWNDTFSISVPLVNATAGLDLGLMTRQSQSGGVYIVQPTATDLLALGEDAWLLVA